MENLNENINYMTKYLKYALDFEKYVYLWENAMKSANNILRGVQQAQGQANTQCIDASVNLASLEDDFSQLEKSKLKKLKTLRRIAVLVPVIGFSLILLGALAISADGKDFDIENFLISLFFIVMYLGMPILIASIICIVRYINFRKNNTKGNLEISKRRTAEMESQRQNQSQLMLQELSIREKCIKKDQGDIFSNLQKAKYDLNKIYSMNMIPAKYRNIVAVATLYEYLCTGRCTQIKGHGGIYDTFEYDMQNRRIISELVQIKQINSQILDNQRILVSEIQKANSTLSSIDSSLNRIEKINTQIAANTAISAAADVQTAQSARYMLDLMY